MDHLHEGIFSQWLLRGHYALKTRTNAGEASDLALPCFCIQTFTIRSFALFERRSYVNQEEISATPSSGCDCLPRRFP